MGIFNSIKKSRRVSSDIDEKIEYLNKELEKTGLREAMSTSNIYVNGGRVPNENFNDFNGLSHGGYGLGLSGADGNGAGGGIIGTLESPHTYAGLSGVALSPPHPITGVRKNAITIPDGTGSSFPLIPGTKSGGNYVRGGALWFFDSNYNFGGQQGRWLNFEWHVSQGSWAFWDTNFLGFYFLNPNLDDYVLNGVNIGTQIKNKIASINFGTNGEIGTPQTLVLTKNNLDDPGFLPINIDGLSTQGFNYLRGKAGIDVSTAPYYSIEDKKNVINYYKKKEADPNYQAKPYERESLIRQMRVQGDGPQFASIDTSFPPSDPDKFPVDPPPEVPDEPPAPPKPDPDPDSDRKKDPAGLDATAIKAGYNDPYFPVNPDGHYIALVTSAQEALSAEMDYAFYSAAANGESPNYNTAAINKAKETLKNAKEKLDNWERWKKENNYVWKGSIDSSAEADRRKNVLDKDKEIDNELEKLKKDQAQAEADAEMYAAEAQKLIAQFGIDVALTLFGGKILSLAGKAVGKIPAVAKFFKLGKAAQKAQIDDALRGQSSKIPNIFKNAKNLSADDVLDQFQNIDQSMYKLFQRNAPLSTSVQGGQTIVKSRTGDILRIYDRKLNKFVKPPEFQLFSHELDKEKLLSEAAKLGHFEPDQLNVNIEDLRKGIMPEFPKDPPPEMVNGYSSKSRLAPKELERSSFIKITKKDLAKNHRLKDSEIKDFMDQINAINEFIKEHPEELIYAQTRYPKSDPRLAQLNWEMDQKLNASKEYMDKHYPENQKLFKKIQKSIKKNIELTDPKSFKGVKVPKFKGVDLTDFKRRKEVVARHFKKAVRTKKIFSKKKT
jgi:hypothetical protein